MDYQQLSKLIINQYPTILSINQKQKPVTDIVKELCNFIDKATLPTEF